MKKDFTEYLKEKFTKAKDVVTTSFDNIKSHLSSKKLNKPVLKNASRAFKKPLLLIPTILTTVALLTGCGDAKIDDRTINAQEAQGISISDASQQELDANRYYGSFLGLDRGNVWDNSETPETTVPEETTPEETTPEETTPETTLPQDNPSNEQATALLNEFDQFVSMHLWMMSGMQGDMPQAKFVSITPIQDNINGHDYNRPYYFAENGFSPSIQPGMTFSTPVYTVTIEVEVNGEIVKIDNIALGVDEFETILNLVGSQQIVVTSNLTQDLVNAPYCESQIGMSAYTPAIIGRDTIAYSNSYGEYQQLLDSIISANANCIEPELADEMGF